MQPLNIDAWCGNSPTVLQVAYPGVHATANCLGCKAPQQPVEHMLISNSMD